MWEKIKKVIIYLRKSRGDEEDALEKHRTRLVSMAKDNNWEYDIFEEGITSGERLIDRPVMQDVLKIIEDSDYDGISVVHYDRLSRGNSKDFGTIIEVLQFANCLIITPEKIYDTNDDDLTLLGIQGVLSHNELRRITNRFIWGKRDGAKMGRWTNGKPPYPYEYKKKIILDERGRENIIGKIILNPEKHKVYDFIKETYLTGNYGTEAISHILNRKKIPSPNNKKWSSNTIQRLLLHEFHMQKVIYGKYQWKKSLDGKRNIIKKRDKSEWAIGKGQHQQTKTPKEHKKILEIMKRNTKFPRKSRAGTFPTSGLMYCKKCGMRMLYSVGRVEVKSGKQYNYTKCGYKTPEGIKCKQRGLKLNEDFYNVLYEAVINQYLDKNNLKEIEEEFSIINLKKIQLQKKINEMQKNEDALNELVIMREEGDINRDIFRKRKKIRSDNINKLNIEINELKNELANFDKMPREEIIKKIEYFKDNWFNITTPKEQNSLLKSIVKAIYYDRSNDDGNVILEIEYL